MEHSEKQQFSEGTLVRYYCNGWRVAYFEKQQPPKRAKFAILIPLKLGKRRLKVPIADVEAIA
jgi:hypothetical protein